MPGPQLYAAIARFQSPNCLYRLLMYRAYARVLFSGSNLSSKYPLRTSPYAPWNGMNCHMPAAPLGFTTCSWKPLSATAR